MKIKDIYVFVELENEPNQVRQVRIKKENYKILQHFINGIENGIHLASEKLNIEVKQNEI